MRWWWQPVVGALVLIVLALTLGQGAPTAAEPIAQAAALRSAQTAAPLPQRLHDTGLYRAGAGTELHAEDRPPQIAAEQR